VIELTRNNSVNAISALDINGGIIIDAGVLNSGTQIISVNGDVDINVGGLFGIEQNGTLKLDAGSTLDVNSGGELQVIGTNQIVLNWIYTEAVDYFNIYRSTDPYNFSGATVFTTSSVGYSEPATGTKYFYYVTAENTTDNEVSRKTKKLGKIQILGEIGR